MCADIIRRNLKTLSDPEKQDFINAVWALKRNGKYDLYVRWHAIAMNRGAHNGPAFLPWHREYLRRFERDLQDEIPDIGLPYWDWSTDGDTTNPTQSSIWNDDLLGGDGDSTNNNFVTSTGDLLCGDFLLGLRLGVIFYEVYESCQKFVEGCEDCFLLCDCHELL